jgi:xylulokinase
VSLVLGVDVGSQSIKAVIVDQEGRVVSCGTAPLTMVHEHDGWAEQDPYAYCTALRDAVRAATRDVQADQVVAMGLGSQVDGVVVCDAVGAPLRAAIIWLDKRATDECDQLTAKVGADALAERTGLVADASHSAPKMMWIREHEPHVWRHTVTLAPVGSYVLHHLSRCYAQDAANASSTMVYDVGKGDFDPELCEAAGLDPAMLPPVRPSTDVIGTLLPGVAAELGLTDKCVLVVGTGDEHAASVGAGAIGSGVVVDVTGTAEPVTTVATEPLHDPLGLVETHGHAVPGTWLIENPGFVSGGSTLWLAKGLLGIPQGDVFDRAREAPPGSDGVLFLPALSGATAPRWNDTMRGAFLGLAMNHTSAHAARAVLEGCAYALRDIVERLRALGLGEGEVRIVGGGARDDLWAAIKANVLGTPVRRVLTDEATAVGAAMIAGVGAGVFPTFTAACVAVQLDPVAIEPDPAVHRIYDDAYHRYLSAFDAVESALAHGPDCAVRST